MDNVLFRAFDTRIYHSFESSPPLVVREVSGWEAPYDRVKRVRYNCAVSSPFRLTSAVPQLLHRKDDLTPMTDPTWIAKALSDLPSRVSQKDGAGTGWRGLGTRVEVANLV